MFLQLAGVAPPRQLIPAGVQRLPADRLYGTGPELAAGVGTPACGATVRMCPGWACREDEPGAGGRERRG
jgi:hypothetical protein